MYKILFKGTGTEPLFVDDEKGEKIWTAWLDNKTARIVAKNFAFNSADIKNISKVEKTEAEMAPHVASGIEQDYLEFRKKMLSLSIEKRANILRIPKMIWGAVSKDVMPESLKATIIERQTAYFTANPKCIYTNPKVYRDLMPKYLPQKNIDAFKPFQNVLAANTLRLIECLVQTDLTYSARP